jgi:hypothetical protein
VNSLPSEQNSDGCSASSPARFIPSDPQRVTQRAPAGSKASARRSERTPSREDSCISSTGGAAALKRKSETSKTIKDWKEITHYAGFHWAKGHHDIVVVDDRGRIVEQFSIEHTKAGWLFLNVPHQKNSGGTVKLPWDISIMMTRVGPGIFFALFGVITVSTALIMPLQMGTPAAGASKKVVPLGITYSYMGGSGSDDAAERADARALLRKEIAVLNTIPRLLRPELPQQDQDSVRRTLGNVKLALIRSVWGTREEGFGDFSQFEEWVNAQEADSPPEGMTGALELYRYGAGRE